MRPSPGIESSATCWRRSNGIDPCCADGRWSTRSTTTLLAPQPWLGFYHRIQGDLDLIERFARRADLVTVTTPTLASSLRRYNSAVRVIRNAVNTEWYEQQAPDSEPRPLSFLYYGMAARLHDYAICRDAVDETARATGGRRIWLGSDDPGVRAVVDEALPYVQEVRDFAAPARGRTAGNRPRTSRPGRLQSQPARNSTGSSTRSPGRPPLHPGPWAAVPMTSFATAWMGCSPATRPSGARSCAGWPPRLRCGRISPAGPRERVLAEYDVRDRAAEWADAFRWAADHAGRGSLRGLTPGLARSRGSGA